MAQNEDILSALPAGLSAAVVGGFFTVFSSELGKRPNQQAKEGAGDRLLHERSEWLEARAAFIVRPVTKNNDCLGKSSIHAVVPGAPLVNARRA
jgi:hypothetical protein